MTVHRPIVDTNGRTYATFDLWWAEVERIATERHGPRETRYKKAPAREVFARNTWSDESSLDSAGLPAAPEGERDQTHLSNQTQRSGGVAHA